jgi:hypothetical protein
MFFLFSTRQTYPLNKTLQLCRANVNLNYTVVFRLYKQLPLICQLAFHRRLVTLESHMIRAMNTAYSAKNAKYPVDNLLTVSLLNSRLSLDKYISNGLLTVDDSDGSVLFSKANNSADKEGKKLSRERIGFVDQSLGELNEADFLLDTSFV